MAVIYTEEELLRAHNRLCAEYKGKAHRYIQKLLQLQRAEQGLDRQLHKFTGTLADDGTEVYCSFCGKPSAEVERIFAASDANICNECIDLCVRITKEIMEEAQQGKQDS